MRRSRPATQEPSAEKGASALRLGIGRAHAGTGILLHVHIIGAATGELLRELTLDPSRNYQPTGRKPGPKPKTP